MKMLAMSVLLLALMGRTWTMRNISGTNSGTGTTAGAAGTAVTSPGGSSAGEAELRDEQRQVIFSAVAYHDDTAIGPFINTTTLIYNKEITSIGGGYDNSTGVFTAPHHGVYYFSFFYHAGGEHNAALLLYKNNDPMAMTGDHKSHADWADNGGNAVFLQLDQGDQVYVRLAANSHVWGSRYHTTFSGFLVTLI